MPAPLRSALGTLAAVALAAAGAPALAGPPEGPGPRDKCPVCGMFVARYPEWTARVVHADGSIAWFDGAKDAFRYVLDPGRFAPGRTRADVRGFSVTDYYGARLVEAERAWYVVGSDVLGPMGHELVPFESEEAAREFRRDHQGKAILRFSDVTPAVLEELR